MSETKNYIEATPEQQQEWFEQDFFMKGDFDVMKLFSKLYPIIIIPFLN